MNRLIPKEKAAELLHHLQTAAIPYEYDAEKHRLTLLDAAGNEQLYFRLPLTFAPPTPAHPAAEVPLNYVILLIQSGYCALGYFEDGVNLDHKVFRSYMVRKKQGKSQIKYLKTKGKSRSGSRVRLGETLEFFENINERLQTYSEEYEVQCIAISCSKTLLPYLFSSKVATPFDKHDPRLYKIPKHVHTPIYDVLLDTNKFLLRGELIYEEAQQALVKELLGDAGETYEDDFAEDDEDLDW
ncbi:hypothetical protein [Pontibacter akesuensis]|nr:hypothetical protein [Pontibacter akesuensis]